MTALKENLEALSASLPDLPAELESLRTLAERVEREVVDFLNQIGERDTQVFARLGELDQALAACGRESEEERIQLEAQADAFGDRLEASLDALRADEQRLAEAAEGVQAPADGVKDSLEEAATSAHGAELEATRALGEVEGAAHAADEGVRAAFDAVQGEAEALQTAVSESGAIVRQATHELLQRMREVAAQAKVRIEQTAERLDGLRAAHEAEVPEQRARLLQEQQEIVVALRERIGSDLNARLDSSTEAVLGALAALGDEGRQATQACQDAQATLAAAFEALGEATRPLPQAIEAVKQAAVQVGLSWG
jgi:hypothetical protein